MGAQAHDVPKDDTTLHPPQGLRATIDAWRQRRAVRWGMDLAFGLIIFLAITAFQTRHLLGGRSPAPDFVLTDMAGQRHELRQYHGKKTLLLFWAPWCTVCHAESDNVKAIKAAYGQDVHVVSVALGYERPEQVQAFMDKHQVDYTVLLGHAQTQRDYKVSAFPTLYLLDERGQIRHALMGYTTTLGMRVRLWLT